MEDRISASHILIMHSDVDNSTSALSREEAKQKITEIKERIAAGEDFAELATGHSDCSSAEEGGELGDFGRGMMVESFETAAFDLKVGEDSPIVETAFGFHLIRRTG